MGSLMVCSEIGILYCKWVAKISAAETFQQKMAAEGDIMDQCADHREIQEGLIDLCVFSWKMAAGRNALWLDHQQAVK